MGIEMNKIRNKIGVGFDHNYIVVRERKRMRDLLKNGFHKVYKNDMISFWADYGADFSWNDNCIGEYNALLADKIWLGLAKKVNAKLGEDFVVEVKGIVNYQISIQVA
jgi:hypothetical protein